MVNQKYVCPFCGFESNGSGECPTCEESLELVCHCGSGKFSKDCCGAEEVEEELQTEAQVAEEVESESSKERQEELKKQAVEDAEEEKMLAEAEKTKDDTY